MSTPDRRLRIVNCGDFCWDLSYILAHLATSQINLPQLPKWLNLRGLQGFCLPFNKLAFLLEMVSQCWDQTVFRLLSLPTTPFLDNFRIADQD